MNPQNRVKTVWTLAAAQSTFDRVAVWDTNNTVLEELEIRFGTTVFDAVGIGACSSRRRAPGGSGGVALEGVNGIEMLTSVRVLRDTEEIASAAPEDHPFCTDEIYLPSSFFLGGPPTGQVRGDCDEDSTADALDCVSFEPCE